MSLRLKLQRIGCSLDPLFNFVVLLSSGLLRSGRLLRLSGTLCGRCFSALSRLGFFLGCGGSGSLGLLNRDLLFFVPGLLEFRFVEARNLMDVVGDFHLESDFATTKRVVTFLLFTALDLILSDLIWKTFNEITLLPIVRDQETHSAILVVKRD